MTATSQHWTRSAGGPGSRSKTTLSGRSTSRARCRGTCISRSARFVAHARVATSCTRQNCITRWFWSLQIGAVLTHGGRCGAVLFVEELAVHSVGIALERERPAPQVREQRRRDSQVEIDHLRLGETRLRIEDLVEIAERQALAADRHLLRGGHPLFLFRPREPFR